MKDALLSPAVPVNAVANALVDALGSERIPVYAPDFRSGSYVTRPAKLLEIRISEAFVANRS